MDEAVRQAMRKWPNVPHCFGWLRLDARGQWRMRDERAQQLQLPGDKINHPALLGFINRNYTSDAQGRWYFQNGPQRVYVDLELTPYVVSTAPDATLLLHTGQILEAPTQAWLTPTGQLLLATATSVAVVDDRDGATILAGLRCAGAAASEEQVLRWLDGNDEHPLDWHYGQLELLLQRIDCSTLEAHFGFVAQPRGDLADAG